MLSKRQWGQPERRAKSLQVAVAPPQQLMEQSMPSSWGGECWLSRAGCILEGAGRAARAGVGARAGGGVSTIIAAAAVALEEEERRLLWLPETALLRVPGPPGAGVGGAAGVGAGAGAEAGAGAGAGAQAGAGAGAEACAGVGAGTGADAGAEAGAGAGADAGAEEGAEAEAEAEVAVTGAAPAARVRTLWAGWEEKLVIMTT